MSLRRLDYSCLISAAVVALILAAAAAYSRGAEPPAKVCDCATTGVCTCPPGECHCPGHRHDQLLAKLPADAPVKLDAPKKADPPAPTPGPPAPPPPAPTGQSATVVVTGCLGSVVSFNGYTSWQVGNTRTLTTPPIANVGHYTVTATGPAHTITGDVAVWPGKTTVVTLNWTNDTLVYAEQKGAIASAGHWETRSVQQCNGQTCQMVQTQVWVADGGLTTDGTYAEGQCGAAGCASCGGGQVRPVRQFFGRRVFGRWR